MGGHCPAHRPEDLPGPGVVPAMQDKGQHMDVTARRDCVEEAPRHRPATTGQTHGRDLVGRLSGRLREVEDHPAQLRAAPQQLLDQGAGADPYHGLGAAPGLAGQDLGHRLGSRRRQAVEAPAGRRVTGQLFLPRPSRTPAPRRPRRAGPSAWSPQAPGTRFHRPRWPGAATSPSASSWLWAELAKRPPGSSVKMPWPASSRCSPSRSAAAAAASAVTDRGPSASRSAIPSTAATWIAWLSTNPRIDSAGWPPRWRPAQQAPTPASAPPLDPIDHPASLLPHPPVPQPAADSPMLGPTVTGCPESPARCR
jgi:hypothetical protein